MSDIGKAGWKNQCKERSGGITDTELGSSREAKTSRLGVCCRGERGYGGGGGLGGGRSPLSLGIKLGF